MSGIYERRTLGAIHKAVRRSARRSCALIVMRRKSGCVGGLGRRRGGWWLVVGGGGVSGGVGRRKKTAKAPAPVWRRTCRHVFSPFGSGGPEARRPGRAETGEPLGQKNRGQCFGTPPLVPGVAELMCPVEAVTIATTWPVT
jgi:hypothetical protein